MATTVTWLLIILQVPFLLAFGYLFLLTLAGLLYRPGRTGGHAARSHFAILVPAHNEEVLLPRLLQSLKETDYPSELRDVFVVADNCTDGTAALAAANGASVFERSDTVERGKGYALQWLLGKIRATGIAYDAFVVLDADCTVSANFFSAMDARLRDGQLVLQGYYTVSNPAESWVSGLRYIALALLHHTRPRGREALGLSCGLFGTGMVFHHSVLEAHGWDTHGLVEDVEYFMKLTDRGIRVRFVPEAYVWSPMPASLREARSQNERWERGRLQVALNFAPRFLWNGLRRGSSRMIDAAVETLIPPLAIAGFGGVVLFALSLVWGRPWPVIVGGAALLALLGHVGIGLLAARAPANVYVAVAFVPWFVAWKLFIYARALLPGRREWVRTQRSK